MGFASYLENINERIGVTLNTHNRLLSAANSAIESADDPAMQDQGAVDELRRLLGELRPLRSELQRSRDELLSLRSTVKECIDLASDPTCDLAYELHLERENAREYAIKLCRAETAIESLQMRNRELSHDKDKLSNEVRVLRVERAKALDPNQRGREIKKYKKRKA